METLYSFGSSPLVTMVLLVLVSMANRLNQKTIEIQQDTNRVLIETIEHQAATIERQRSLIEEEPEEVSPVSVEEPEPRPLEAKTELPTELVAQIDNARSAPSDVSLEERVQTLEHNQTLISQELDKLQAKIDPVNAPQAKAEVPTKENPNPVATRAGHDPNCQCSVTGVCTCGTGCPCSHNTASGVAAGNFSSSTTQYLLKANGRYYRDTPANRQALGFPQTNTGLNVQVCPSGTYPVQSTSYQTYSTVSPISSVTVPGVLPWRSRTYWNYGPNVGVQSYSNGSVRCSGGQCWLE